MMFSWFVGFGAADDQVVPSLRNDSSRVGRDNLIFRFFFRKGEEFLCQARGKFAPQLVACAGQWKIP